jgi:hypothetical protein
VVEQIGDGRRLVAPASGQAGPVDGHGEDSLLSNLQKNVHCFTPLLKGAMLLKRRNRVSARNSVSRSGF